MKINMNIIYKDIKLKEHIHFVLALAEKLKSTGKVIQGVIFPIN